MNWELVKEVLRRAEAKAKVRGIQEPLASIRIDSDENWRVYVKDDEGNSSRVDGGKGADDMSVLLGQLRDRQTF